jgi:hypothetical protein
MDNKTTTERIQERIYEEIEYYFDKSKTNEERADRVKVSMAVSKLASNYAQYEIMRLQKDRILLGQRENVRKRKRYEKA